MKGNLRLFSGYRKMIFIDRKSAAAGGDAWVIRTFRASDNWEPRDYLCESFTFHGELTPKGSRDVITPPAFWLETFCAINLKNWSERK